MLMQSTQTKHALSGLGGKNTESVFLSSKIGLNQYRAKVTFKESFIEKK